MARRASLRLAPFVLAIALAGLVLPISAAREGFGAIETITAQDLRAHLEFLASPQLRGRATPSQELDIAARYLAAQAARLGLTPGGSDDGYLQAYMVARERVVPERSELRIGELVFTAPKDFIAAARAGRAQGELTYLGDARASEDANEPFGNLPVKDRILIAHVPGRGDRQAGEPAVPAPRRSLLQQAARAGAAAVIYLPTFRQMGNWGAREPVVPTERAFVEGLEPGMEPPPPPIPAIMASPGLVKVLFEGTRLEPEDVLARQLRGEPAEPFALPASKSLELQIETETERTPAYNVVALLEGANPALDAEHVLLSAHFDHVGVTAAARALDADDPFARVPAGAVYPGADDNGSGTAALIEIAEAFARSERPPRSLAIVWHSGEERGLWGARWFVEHPVIPLSDVVANLNVDMIGRSRPAGAAAEGTLTGAREVHVIGSRRQSPALGDLIDRVNRQYLRLDLNRSLDAPDEPLKLYERSDHFIYARRGVPVAFFFSGLHPDYHETTDTVDKIDFSKLEAVTRTIHAVAWTIARDGLPRRTGSGSSRETGAAERD